MRSVLSAGLLLLLAACQLPQPFAHVGPVKDNSLIELPSTKTVRVALAPDVAPEFAEPLTEATVKALADFGIPASANATSNVGYVLTSGVELTRSSADGPEVAAFAWTLANLNGKSVGSFDQRIDGGDAGWLANDPGIFDVVAHDVGPQIVAMLEKDANGNATVDGETEAAVPEQRPKLFFSGVTGAPGDGNEALTKALTRVLERAHTPMTDDQEQATLILAGTVAAEAQNDGISKVAISWRLTDRSGAEVSKIDQANPVRTAAISGKWGNLAAMVAEAAGDGIADAWDLVTRPTDSSRRIVVPR